MNTKSLFLLLTLVFFIQAGKAQDMPGEEQISWEEQFVEGDSVVVMPPDIEATSDSVAVSEKEALRMKVFKPDPKKALWFSIVPGLGQIYNRKYWKLPIVYGGFMGCAYAVTWNNRTYNDYKDAYLQLMTDPDNPNPLWWNYVPPGIDPEAYKGRMGSYLKNNKDTYRRYRDLSIIVTVAVYFLSIIDAYVDAQLYDFDISPDLGVRVEPAVFERTATNAQSYGLQCNIKF